MSFRPNIVAVTGAGVLVVATGSLLGKQLQRQGTIVPGTCQDTAALEYVLAFAPEDGSTVEKILDLRWSLTGKQARFSMGGSGQEVDLRSEFSGLRQATWSDIYGPCSDGRPLSLVRTFDSLGGGTNFVLSPFGSTPDGASGKLPEWESDLEDTTTLFRWDTEKHDYRIEWGEGKRAEEEVLGGLRENTDLRRLLPEGPVKIGDDWEVTPDALCDVLLPLGDLKLGLEERNSVGIAFTGDRIVPLGTAVLIDVFGELAGEVRARLIDVHEKDGRSLAQIALDIEVTSTTDLQHRMSSPLVPEKRVELHRIGFELELNGRGKLLWDVMAGRFRSFELKATIDVSYSAAWKMWPEWGSDSYFDLEVDQGLEGHYGLELNANPVEEG